MRRAATHLLTLSTLILVLTAVLVTVLRLALPLADGYRDRVAAVLTERLGYPVRVGALSLRLAGLTPRLTLDDVTLRDPTLGTEVLSLRTLELDLAPLDSMRMGSPQWRALTLVGARLAVRRLRDGRVRVVGLHGLVGDDPRPLELFLTQGRLDLIDSEILIADDRLGGPILRLGALRLRLSNDGTDHRLSLSARPSAASPGRPANPADGWLRVQARLQGEADDLGLWGGQVYWGLGGKDLATLIPPGLLPPDWGAGRVHSRQLEWQSWVRLDSGRLAEALSRIGLDGLALGAAASRPSADPPGGSPAATARSRAKATPGASPTKDVATELRLDRLGALVRVTPEDQGWRVQTAQLGLSTGGARLDDIGLDLGLSGDGRLRRFDLDAGALDLGVVATLARQIAGLYPLPQGLGTLLEHRPSGRLAGLALRLGLPSGAPPRWLVKARGQGLGLAGSGGIPGFDGLCALLEANQDAGSLRLASEGLTLDLAPLFDRPIGLEQLAGRIAWTRDPDGAIRLTGHNLVAENADLRGRARFALDLPAPGNDVGPFLDLRASFADVDGAKTRTYLPVGIMHGDLIAWLERAVVAARVPQADLVLRGPLKRFPFHDQEGRFELLLELQNGLLDYRQGWPPLEGLSGELLFQNQGLDIAIDTGRIYRTRVASATATVPDLTRPRLEIHAQGEGPLSDGLRLLRETPLSQQLGPVGRALEGEGEVHLDLGLQIPLHEGETLGVDGRLGWPGPARVGLAGTPIVLSALRGGLRFTENALFSQSLEGELWGRPVDLSIATRRPGEPDSVTEVRARTRLPVRDLAGRAPSPAWRLARGDFDVDLSVSLRNADLRGARLPLDLNLQSDLRGLALDLPPPFGKAAGLAAPMELRADLEPGRRLAVTGGVEGVALSLDLDLGAGGPRLERGRVRLGGGEPEPPPSGGLWVDGSLDTLDVPLWSDWWDRARLGFNDLGASDLASGAQLRSLDLRVGRLDLGGAVLDEARLRVEPPGLARSGGQAGDWVVQVRSRQLDGTLVIPPAGEGTPPTLDLSRLDLKGLLGPGPDSEAAPTVPGRPPDQATDRPLPALGLQIDDLRWGEGSLGRLGLRVAPDELGTRIADIDFRGAGDTVVTGSGAWIDGEDGGRGRISLLVRSKDPGPILRELDSPNAVSLAPLDATVKLEWPGSLQSFSLARSVGQVQIELGAGTLPQVEPGVGRVLGFLNLGALTRRLSLDFRDLYQEGFSFERISGRIDIRGGRATVQAMEIDGPASRVRIGGYSDLRNRTFDQTVTVEPSIGTSLAIAGAVAGGPAVGAAVFALDRISGGAIDRFGSFQYRLTGPWSDPVLQPVGWEPFAQPQGGGAGPSEKGPSKDGRPERPNAFLE